MLLNYIESGSAFMVDYLYPMVFTSALLESTPIIGTFTPGTLLFLFFGYATSVNHVNLALIILFATIGAFLGDILGYLLGRYAGGWMIRHKKILKQAHIDQGRGFFSKHGGKSILIGRFVGPIRSIVPLIAGSIHMGFSKFMFWNILGAFLWSTLYIILGFFFGAYVREIEKIVSNTGICMTLAIIIIAVVFYFIYKKKKQCVK